MNNIKPQKLCECGCGQPAPIATRNWHTKEIKKGQPLRYICGHHRRGKQQSLEEKTKRVKKWGVDNVNISPYLPGNKVVRYSEPQKRWYVCAKSGSRTTHARIVYQHHYGKIPSGYVVHHKSGSAVSLEDDRPDNLMIVTHKWNFHFFPRLSEGFQVPEKVVTDIYCKVEKDLDDDMLFTEVCRKLIEYKETP